MRKLLLSLLVLITATVGYAQNDDFKFGVGIHTGTQTYFGDLGNEFLSFDKTHPTFGLSLSMDFTKLLGATYEFGHGVIDHNNGVDRFRANMNHHNLLVRFKLNNDIILPADSKWAPFLFSGAGLNKIFKSPTTPEWGTTEPRAVFNFPLGAGVNLNLNRRFSLQWKSSWNFMGTDQVDTKEPADRGKYNNDQFMYHNVGVVIHVYDPNPDKDADGVLNRDDECPEVPGPFENKGCPWPDTDNDGVPDIDDKCPDVPGTLKGCPDADGDGIEDSKDDCPNEKGPKATNGCPDADKDGVKDSEDKCPDVYGLKKFAGCPDTDGDGIIDSEDKCPNEAGVPERDGCPLPKEKNLDIIYFDFNSYSLTNQGIKSLKNIAEVINSGEFKVVEISGNADNIGPDQQIVRISELRALNVRNYLIGLGCNPEMFKVEFFGDDNPAAPNDSREGRQKNRRTEIKAKFK